jgi:fatty-acyl-CoA synthase
VEFNLADLWEAVADAVPDHEAIVRGATRRTYAELDARANRLAHHLQSVGIGPGDHVAIYLANSIEHLECLLAAFKIRAVPVNVNYRYVDEELRYLLDDCDAKALAFDREFATRVARVRASLPGLEALVMVDDGTGADVPAHLGADDYESALAAESPERDFGPRSPDDLYIVYTGGSTGNPKGVMWRAEDIFFGALTGGTALGGTTIARPEDVTADLDHGLRCHPACPLMHGTGQWVALFTLYSGGSIVLLEDRHFDSRATWELVARERVAFLAIVGDAFARPLVEAYDDLDPSIDVSSLIVVLSGGAILSPAVRAAWTDRLPGILLIDGFGASETGSQGQALAAAPDGGHAPSFKVDDDTTVLGDDLRPAPVGVVGKLARRGHVPLGYYKDPEKSAATFPVVDGIRWSVPGDHARREADGSITLLGRGSVSINTGGEKVYPEEVEGVLKSHPAVFDAVVVGVPDERWGERVVAVVQPRPGTEVTLDELAAHAGAHLARFKSPRDLVVVDEIIRSPSGKPDYRWARALAERS